MTAGALKSGEKLYEEKLKQQAESKGFRFDDTRLFPSTQPSGGKWGAKGSASLKFYTEKEIFDFLDLPWLEPHEEISKYVNGLQV
ncbi:DNA polymerase lambda [Glycine soja]|uniref:DNA polymerase lambda n=1 Tax=Glycine soja TaxID=3848 RepID=A0A445LIT3_GLYSO|nr:DNA polymerase lambda [Glycine soja]